LSLRRSPPNRKIADSPSETETIGAPKSWRKALRELQASNGVAVYTVNGQIVNRTSAVMDSTGKPVTAGYIAWQAEQAEVYYRNLRIQVLP